MAKADFSSVDEYIASQPEPAQAALKLVRKTIRAAVPKAEEVISYKMPTYKLHGEVVIYFAGWKKHFSIYPATRRVLEAFKKELAIHEVNKSTVRFPLSQPVPEELLARITKFRAKEVARRGAPKASSARRSA